jgi:hypothetical protein
LQPDSWVFRSQHLLNLPNDFGKNRRIKMGGRGSGRRSSYSGKAETSDSMPLDIRKITRKGLLVPGNGFSWQWLVNDRQVAGISIRVDLTKHGAVLPHEEHRRSGRATGADANLTLPPGRAAPLVHLPTVQQAGGGALRAGPVLCLPPVWWAGLRHAERRRWRPGIHQADKLRKRLGWEAGILNGDGGKPKGMHWKTYQRLKSHHDALVQVSLHDIGRKLGFLHKLLEG